MIHDVVSVRPLDNYKVELVFSDGAKGVADLSDWIVNRGGVMEPLEDPGFFKRVRVNPETGTIQWPNRVDFCPVVLYARVTGRSVSEAEHAA